MVLNLAAGCISNCGVLDGTAVANTGNGAGSTNTAGVNSTANNSTAQTNNANVTSNLDLTSISGNNTASFNTGGDSSITTGDANVSANALTFANNNIAGGVIYGIVNIYGVLTGNIVLTQDALNAICGNCLAGGTNVSNTGNGANSTNNATSNQTVNNTTGQSNTATIDNNLILNAQTGDNSTSLNTGGNNGITTGASNVTANVLNIANSNINGGAPMWLVIINRAGQWIGQIIGAPGSDMAGSVGTEFIVNPDGSITVSNGGNGAGSTNTATDSQTTNNTTTQTNNATITNNLNLTANTGGNKSNFNTNGDSSITTGDANIIANLVNFVNNNITGGGKLVVTVVNVFGKWFGDFVGPGQSEPTVAAASASDPSSGGGSSGGSSGSSNSGSSGSSGSSQTPVPTYHPQVFGTSISNSASAGNELAYAGGSGFESSITHDSGSGTLNINLAWGLPIIPLGLVGFFIRRRFFV